MIVLPKVYARHRRAARGSAALVAEGHVQKQGEVIHVVVKRVVDLADALPGVWAGVTGLPLIGGKRSANMTPKLLVNFRCVQRKIERLAMG